MSNKFFALFSGIWNWVLNLFDANHYQIIDAERYRTEDQFYVSSSKKSDDKKEEETKEVNQVNDWIVAEQAANNSQSNSDNSNSEWKTLDNDQQISINNQDIWIDLSGHEINNPENQINN